MNFHSSHIPFSRLLAWVEEELAAAERNQVQQHLESCLHCRGEAARLTRMLVLMRTDDAIDPPAAVLSRALKIFRPRPVPAQPSLFQRIVAVLQFDSAQLAPALALRTTSTPRQLLFTAGAYDLDLRLTPRKDSWLLSGQLLGDDVDAGEVILQSGSDRVQAPLVTPGEFVLPPIPAGAYRLVVNLPDYEIAVDSLQVG